jgi:hypothetical protein
MDRQTVVDRMQAIKAMPGFQFADRSARAETPEQFEQENAVFVELDNFIDTCVNQVPRATSSQTRTASG